MDGYLIAARLAHITALTLLSGTAFLKLYADPRRAAALPPEVAAAFDAWLRRIGIAAAAVAFVSALAWWDSLAANMGGTWSDAVDPQTLGTVLLSTQFGWLWTWHLLLALIVFFAFLGWDRLGRVGDVVVSGLAVGLLVTLSGTGHTAMHRGVPGTIHHVADALHLGCAGLWIGGLASLGYILVRGARSTAWMSLARYMVPRFSRIGYATVVVLFASGLVNASFLVSPANLLDTAYGRVLIAKVCLFVVMVVLALANRRIFFPRTLAPNGTQAQQPSLALRNSVLLEMSLGLLVLGLVSVLGTLPPAH